LQDTFHAPLYFQMTDDEKFLFKEDLSQEDTLRNTYDNALDVIALGFDPKLTKIIVDTKCIKTLYPLALKVAKKVTFSTTKAVFGFDNSTNIGSIFFTSIQSAPAAALAGVVVPLSLKRFGVDPAVAGGVIVTTVTDVVGFAALLGLGTLILR
jgi:tryptophanyl-tRNA synthetase